MELNLERLKGLWQERQDFCKRWKNKPSKNDIRFEYLTKVINKLIQCKVEVALESGSTIKLDNFSMDLDHWSTKYFGPMENDLPTDSAQECMKRLLDKIDKMNLDANDNHELKGLLFDVWSLLGFPVKDVKDDDFLTERRPEWRIMSNALTKGKDSQGSLSIVQLNPDAHFASNNHFFQIIRLLNKVATDGGQKKFGELIGDGKGLVPLVLRYPSLKNADLDAEARLQRDILETRFPLKFLWMWAQKDKLIVPISLLGFRRLCQSQLYVDVLTKLPDLDKKLKKENLREPCENLIDSKYDLFSESWQAFSNQLFKELGIPDGSQACSDSEAPAQLILSKLLSAWLLDPEDHVRITELIQTGCRAIILYGPPGTGKTYEAKKIAEKLTKKEEKQKKIVQFHPSYSYEDFIEGIRPVVKNGGIAYEVKDGQFKKFCSDARRALEGSGEHSDSPAYVFIADEINRANLSDVLGELLYCLEYRNIEITLPYSEKPFSIPENVYFIGTMNNVDKSLVTFDLALRRRFIWYEIKPDPTILFDAELLGNIVDQESLQRFVEKCQELNRLITSHNEENGLGLDEQYQIGHAYFLKIKDFLQTTNENNSQKENCVISSLHLEDLWLYHLRPLLDEYLVTQDRMSSIKDNLKNLKKTFVKAR